VLALGVVPALRGGLASACAHGREGLASGAVGARAGVGGAGPASGDVAADAAGHREAIAHRGHVGLAVVAADRLSDRVGPLVGVDQSRVCEPHALRPEPVAGSWRKAASWRVARPSDCQSPRAPSLIPAAAGESWEASSPAARAFASAGARRAASIWARPLSY